ncbi:MAG: sodium/proton-translocating pyrophosphatase, partial [Chitinispirillaceae bacterium]|nr:sodium/proton-translocating pyrophosphatase [Chitinispirillaceae bacterium]
MNLTYLYIGIGAGVLALLFAYFKSMWIMKQDQGTDKMKEIGKAIHEGAMAFLAREYKVLSIFGLCVAILLVIFNTGMVKLTAGAFIVGAFCSA